MSAPTGFRSINNFGLGKTKIQIDSTFRDVTFISVVCGSLFAWVARHTAAMVISHAGTLSCCINTAQVARVVDVMPHRILLRSFRPLHAPEQSILSHQGYI